MQSNIFLVYGTAKPRDVGNGGGGGGIFLTVLGMIPEKSGCDDWKNKNANTPYEHFWQIPVNMKVYIKICKSKFANRISRKISTEAKKCTAWYKQKTTDKCHNEKTTKTLNPFQATLNWHSLKYKAKNKLQTTLTSWQSFKSNYQCSLVV